MIRWDECCDVLVIGAGAGGMSAAARAHDLGLDTLLIEPGGQYGGADDASRVRFEREPLPFDAAVLGEELLRMRAASPETLLLGRMAMTCAEARVIRQRDKGWMAVGARVLWRYWRDREGRRLSPRDRFLTADSALIGGLRSGLLERRVPLWLNCSFEHLLFAAEGVAGVRARRDGERLNIKARHGVILAVPWSGGANPGVHAIGAHAMACGRRAAHQIRSQSQQRQRPWVLAMTGR